MISSVPPVPKEFGCNQIFWRVTRRLASSRRPIGWRGRRTRRYQPWLKLGLVGDHRSHLLLAAVVTKGPSNDSPLLPLAVRQACARASLRQLLWDAADVVLSAFNFLKICFAGEMELLTPTGRKRIDALREGDLILSRDEDDPFGLLEPKRVEEVFTSFARLWHVHVGGSVIRTTSEHPFFVRHRGWLEAGKLRIGDELLSSSGAWLPVEDLCDAGVEERVYNVRIADYHTYFVGAPNAAAAVWAHNACGAFGKLQTNAGQARNHLNQVAAFGSRKVAGGIDYYKAVAHHLSHPAHAAFHRSLRAFWRPYQKGGALYQIARPTNAQYASALRSALREAGVHGMELGRLLGWAAAERRAAGFLPHLPVPRIPGL